MFEQQSTMNTTRACRSWHGLLESGWHTYHWCSRYSSRSQYGWISRSPCTHCKGSLSVSCSSASVAVCTMFWPQSSLPITPSGAIMIGVSLCRLPVTIGGLAAGAFAWKTIDPGFSAFFDTALAKVQSWHAGVAKSPCGCCQDSTRPVVSWRQCFPDGIFPWGSIRDSS